MSLRGIAMETLKLPPFTPLAKLLYRHQFARQRHGNHYLGVFPSYASALAAVPAALKASYDQPQAAAQYRYRTRQLAIGDYPTLYWLEQLLHRNCRRFFDLGGHIGVAYYAFARYLDYPGDITWTVSDMPTTMEAGRAWAAEHDAAHRLAFAADKNAADGQDALLVLGALQYFDFDLPAWLGTLAAPPRHLIVNSSPMHDHHDFHTLQNMGFACLPYHVHARPAFIRAMGELGYRVVDAWRCEERECRIPFAHDHDVEGYSGFYFSRANN